jgi:opacity protein-like surface antigen
VKRSELISFASLAFLVLYSGSSSAANRNSSKGFYIKAGVGVMKHLKFKEVPGSYVRKAPRGAPIYRAGIGYKFNKYIRSDITVQYAELRYRATGLNQGIHTTAAFLNGYLDINFNKPIVPYLTAGVGIGNNRAGAFTDTSTTSVLARRGKSRTNFVWSAGAGTKYNFNKKYALDLEYRYVNLGKMRTDGVVFFATPLEGINQNIRGHQIMGSLIYSF